MGRMGGDPGLDPYSEMARASHCPAMAGHGHIQATDLLASVTTAYRPRGEEKVEGRGRNNIGKTGEGERRKHWQRRAKKSSLLWCLAGVWDTDRQKRAGLQRRMRRWRHLAVPPPPGRSCLLAANASRSVWYVTGKRTSSGALLTAGPRFQVDRRPPFLD